jgi:ABC-2 type transport system permease protein
MKTMKWLLRREFWEHKGAMLWSPLVVAGITLALMLTSLGYGLVNHHLNFTVNGHDAAARGVYAGLPPDARADIVNVATSGYMAVSAPLFLILAFVVFRYCLGALHDERRDRSILFWKSLPASDEATVLSKVITAACVSPVITIAIATAMSLAFLLFSCFALAFNGVNVFAAVLASPNLYLAPIGLLSLVPVYVVWALPTIGWLLLVSSWARSKVSVWAVGAPLVALLMVKWVSFTLPGGHAMVEMARDVVARILGGLIPGIWFVFREIDPSLLHQAGKKGVDVAAVIQQSWMTLGTLDAWIGVVLGAAMIFAAMRVRRYRDEG